MYITPSGTRQDKEENIASTIFYFYPKRLRLTNCCGSMNTESIRISLVKIIITISQRQLLSDTNINISFCQRG
jgi:hypothetical protein